MSLAQTNGRVNLYPGAAAAGLFLCGLLALTNLVRGFGKTLEADDAYMFHRYAMFVRSAHKIIWNPGGEPTYGLTSIPWLFATLPFSYLPLPADKGLVLASWIAGVAAIACLIAVVHSFAPDRKTTLIAIGASAYVLAVPIFFEHFVSGLETMLSMLSNTIFLASMLYFQRAPGAKRAVLSGLAGYFIFFVRPENAIFAVLCPLVMFLCDRTVRLKYLVVLGSVTAGLALLQLVLCDVYFGTPVPLSFYAKSSRSYAGFTSREHAITYSIAYLVVTLPFLATLGIFANFRNRRLWLPYVVPAAAAFAYFETVTQIMGFFCRFYIPITPFLLIPALLVFGTKTADPSPRRVAGAIASVMLPALALSTHRGPLDQMYFKPNPIPEPRTAGVSPPRLKWFQAIHLFGDEVMAKLPPGTRVAASEVGYIGAVAPEVSIIDLAGLNDTRLGIRGFSMTYVLERRPDIIWLPDDAYTGMRAEILSSPRFWRDYEFHKGAFNYGVAVSKLSPRRSQILGIFNAAYSKAYGRSPTPMRQSAAREP